jgi:hypothetical protein
MGEATPKMRSYALRLTEERQLPECGPYKWEADIRATIRRLQEDAAGQRRYVQFRDCAAVIDYLKTLPRKDADPAEPAQARPRAAMVKPGCFIMAGKIWVAHERKDKLGVWVEQLVEGTPDRIHDASGDRVNFELVYVKETSIRVVQDLTEAHRMTFAQARDYMIRFGTCFAPVGRGICGLRLKAADSVELAIGPVCGPKFPGYHEAVEELRASRKHALYEQARDELGIALSDVALYRIAGGQVSTVAGIEKKLDRTPATV